MPYTKQTFITGDPTTPLSAASQNNQEDGISTAWRLCEDYQRVVAGPGTSQNFPNTATSFSNKAAINDFQAFSFTMPTGDLMVEMYLSEVFGNTINKGVHHYVEDSTTSAIRAYGVLITPPVASAHIVFRIQGIITNQHYAAGTLVTLRGAVVLETGFTASASAYSIYNENSPSMLRVWQA